MRQFKDNAGRTWTVDINVATLKRVRGLTGVDLMQVIEGTLIEKFIRDPVLLCDVVYAVCKPEADSAKVSDEEFGKAMAGDAIEAATGAVLDELISFCPSPRDRANLGPASRGGAHEGVQVGGGDARPRGLPEGLVVVHVVMHRRVV